MSRSRVVRRLALLVASMTMTAGLGACSGGIDRSEYTSPIAATAAPAPVVPISTGAAPNHGGRLPLLPPVPDEQTGLPPVTVAQLLPPVVH